MLEKIVIVSVIIEIIASLHYELHRLFVIVPPINELKLLRLRCVR